MHGSGAQKIALRRELSYNGRLLAVLYEMSGMKWMDEAVSLSNLRSDLQREPRCSFPPAAWHEW